MKISVIIPSLNEKNSIVRCIESVKKIEPCEIIVVDGGSSDDTVSMAIKQGARVINSPKGRGIQLKKGASEAKGEILLFVHADAKLPEDVRAEDLVNVIKSGYVGGFFRLRFDADKLSIRLVEIFANIRSRLLSLPYGDQAIFVSKRAYDDIGGFKDYPFLEDLDLVVRLRKIGRFKMIEKPILVSSRRLLRGYPLSPILISLRNAIIALLFMFGVKPEKLVRLYR